MDEPRHAAIRYPGGWLPVRYGERCRRRKALLSEALKDAIDACRANPDVTLLIVFGSYARDEVSPWSDLDLLVVSEGNVRDAVAAIYACGALGEVIGAGAQNWKERLQRNPLGETILREGVQVYARSQS
jgi:predicted nucleotidyltransferase